MEIRVNSNRAIKIIKKFSMPNFLEIPPIGFSGGTWKNKADFRISVLKTHDRFIHCHIRDFRKDFCG